ncbi:MAG: type II toxin-antitoxin system MqsA family antitoxin [Chlorobiaceae bacterium]|jgi:HTH-type transcriptional regulator / antitoxin MqsA|nr:type II toxin-antitoxin system MqsA family antitoxin [Chlorobiaceae bacterium]
MKCPACGHPEMVDKVLDETLTYGGQSLTLHHMHGQFCSLCGEGIWDEESYRRYTESQETLVRTAKGDVSSEIRRIRKRLNLTQSELAQLFGVGKVAFSRYERGESRPPSPLVKLLRLVDRHPDLLDEMKAS